jgi:hypothetical protein
MRRRKLLRIVRRASDAQGFQLFNRFDSLWKLFLEICRHNGDELIVIVIDAIDEYEEQIQVSMTKRIVDLLGSEPEFSIKFFITSRPNVPATFVLRSAATQCIRLNLEENQIAINEDIKLVIRQRLDALVDRGRCDPETRDRLQELLVNKADRTFLWVSMVLSLLEVRRFLTPRDLHGLAKKLPSDLRAFNKNFLGTIPAGDAKLAGKLLRIVVASSRPLCEKEVQAIFAMDEQQAPEGSSPIQGTGLRLDSIQMLLGPLVRDLGSKIHLIHQSLKEYRCTLLN